MMNEETKDTKEPRSTAVAVNTKKRKKRKKSGACVRLSVNMASGEAGGLSIVHRRGRGSTYLGRWARTPALPSFFRPMLLEDWKPVKIAIQDCLTW